LRRTITFRCPAHVLQWGPALAKAGTISIKANSHNHAVPMPRPCRVAKSLDCVFLFDIHSAAVFDSHTPYRARAMPRPCRSESVFSRPRHSAAWAWHGMCELTSAVQRRHLGDLPSSGFFQVPRGIPRRLLSEEYQSVKL
jgi:hypothetical protein